MKSWTLLFAAALVSCSQSERETTPLNTQEAIEAAAAPIAADGRPTVGRYKVTTPDGDIYMEDVRADGTFTSTGPDGSQVSGTWEQKSQALYCTRTDGDTLGQRCHTESVDENGVWTSTDPEGIPAKVERVRP